MSDFIIVDDIDLAFIVYNGDWTETDASSLLYQPGIGMITPTPFNNTLHSVRSSAEASLSFNFTGSSFVLGGWFLGALEAQSGVHCSVDGQPLTPSPLSESITIQSFFCKSDNLHDGSHSVTLAVTNATAAWFDYVRYRPLSAGTSSIDFHIIESGAAKVTSANSERQNQLQLTFSGDSITCLACVPGPGLATNSGGTMSVTIDENIKQTFPMNNTVFCDLPLPSSGSHNVRIDYDEDKSLPNFCKPSVVFGIGICEASQPGNCGNVSSSNPNGVSAQSSSTAAIPGASFPPPSASGSAIYAATSEGNNLGNRVGAIVGGVIGGLVLVLLAAFAFLLLRRRRYLKKRAFIGGEDNIIRPLDDDATLPPPKYEDIGNQPRPLSSSMSTKSMIRPTLPQRSSMAKSIMSWNELRIDTGPQQTAQVGDDFGHSLLDSPRHEFRFSLSEVKRET